VATSRIPGLDYFNLNRQANRSLQKLVGPAVAAAKPQDVTAKEVTATLPKMSFFEQFVLYLTTVVGVLGSSVVLQYIKEQKLDPNLINRLTQQLSLAEIGVAAIVALLLMPTTFQQLGVQANSSFLFKVALFLKHGVFYSLILGTATQVISR
jgi:hypothetical protein